jgi:hypothetical protein
MWDHIYVYFIDLMVDLHISCMEINKNEPSISLQINVINHIFISQLFYNVDVLV